MNADFVEALRIVKYKRDPVQKYEAQFGFEKLQ